MHLFEEKEMQMGEMISPKSHKRKAKRKFRQALRQETVNEIFTEFGGLPKPKESYTIISNGGFDCICYLRYIIEKVKTIDELYLATWIINRENAREIFDYLDNGVIKNATLIISNRTRQLRKQDWGFIIEGLKNRGAKVRIPQTHAKLFSVANHAKKTYITVEGSGNWNENKRIENYSVSNDAQLFLFHKNWMDEIYNG